MLRKWLYVLVQIGVSIAALLVLSPAQAVWACGGTVICVDVDAGGAATGLSWTDAFTNVQDALAVTHAYSDTDYEIWIAAGIYTPDVGGGATAGDPAASFRIAYNNVKLYGGFAGTETTRDQRDPEAHPTILSGDLQQDDTVDARGVVTTTDGISGTNATHVLYLDGVTNEELTGDTVIDGVIITAGQANATMGPTGYGGGLYCGGRGGGNACSPSLTNVTFSGNWAFVCGGGMYNDGYSAGAGNPRLTNVTFSGNQSVYYGGGMYNSGGGGGNSSPTLTNVTFNDNQAERGGGMYNGAAKGGISSPTLTGVTFSGNQARTGGGIFNEGTFDSTSSPSLTNVTFSDNQATEYGGGMFNTGNATGESSPSLTNVTFSGNHAGVDGGGMVSIGGTGVSRPSLTNVILWGNTAITSGHQMYNLEATPTLSYTLVQSGTNDIVNDDSVVTYGPGMLLIDPADLANDQLLLGPLGDYGGATPTLPLLPGSPAIDVGSPTTCPATDQRGVVRPQGGGCDIGAFESQGFALTPAAGDGQRTFWGMDFADAFRVTVSGISGEPVDGGVVAFRTPTSGPSVTLSGYPDGVVPIISGSATVTGTANIPVGSYVVTATTSGVITPVLMTLTNDPRPTEITASVSPTQTLYADYVQFHAAVTDTAESRPATSGWVTFTVAAAGGTPVAAYGAAVGSDGMAFAGTSQLAVGTYAVTAILEEDRYLSSTSPGVPLIVDPLPATLALTKTAASSVYGNIVTFVARAGTTRSGLGRADVEKKTIIPTGVVTFTEGQTALAVVALDATGQAIFSSNTLPGGDHTITVSYGGDAICTPGVSDPLTHTVTPRDTELALYAVPAQTGYGQIVTFMASVRGVATQDLLGASGMPAIPSGDVAFRDGTVELGTATLDANGVVTFAVATLPAGDHAITAAYRGDDNYAPGVSAVHTQTVTLADPTIGVITGAQDGDSYLGERVTLTVTVEGGLRPTVAARAAGGDTVSPATGDVILREGALPEGEAVVAVATLVDGTAVFTLDGLPVGHHTFTIVYEGDANYAARNSAPFVHTVWTRLYLPLYIAAPSWPIWW